MGSLNKRYAVYAGSFDPLTLGHLHIIERGAAIFDRLTVAIGINPEKKALFEPDERMALVQESIRTFPAVDVCCFEGLTVNFLKTCNAGIMLRGVRTLSDLEFEFTMSLANRRLAPDIETVFLMASEEYTHISSTLIKQIARLGGEGTEDHLRQFVPEPVVAPLAIKFRNRATDLREAN